MALPLAAIFGCAGPVLTAEERAFFAAHPPVGFILFARNCVDPEQVKALVSSFYEVTGARELLVLIDQEGGRVARLKPPHWRAAPPAGLFAELWQHSPEAAREACFLNARLIAAELAALGITVNCAPMADIRFADSHAIIGDRAFGMDAATVTALARAQADGLLAGGVLPVLKHIPGHGRALVDSHETLPEVTAPRAALEAEDFKPFRALATIPLGMTAHIRYSAIDDEVATLSPTVIALIRSEIGFDGLLMSDDISMKALSGDMASLTQRILRAGCDVVLHCNGNMAEMQAVVAAQPALSTAAAARLARAHAARTAPQAFDDAAALTQLAALTAPLRVVA